MVSIATIRSIIEKARKLAPKNLIWVQPRNYPIPAPYWPATDAQVRIARDFSNLRISRPAHSFLTDDYHTNEDAIDFIANDRRDIFRTFMRALRDPWGSYGFALGFARADEHLHVDARSYGPRGCRVRLEVDKPGSGRRWRVCPTDPDWNAQLLRAARQYGFQHPDDALPGPSWPLLLGATGAVFFFWRRKKKRASEKRKVEAESENLSE